MPPVSRDSGGPEGRQKTSLPASGFHKTSRQDAGVGLACLNYRVRAAGRGVGREAGQVPGKEARLPCGVRLTRAFSGECQSGADRA